MSVVMILKTAGDPAAKARVVTRHMFAAGDGELLVIDEWPDEGSFRGFFADQQAQIGTIMQSMGVTGEPEVSFYRELDTPDVL